jgi:hypothetical protein
MADKKPEPTQKSRPKEGDPVEIPMPKRKDFDKLLERATQKTLKGREPKRPTSPRSRGKGSRRVPWRG